jgi:hypothetical protein
MRRGGPLFPALGARLSCMLAASKFYAHRGAFICAGVNREENGKKWYSVSIGAKTGHPLQVLKPLLDKSWDRVAI